MRHIGTTLPCLATFSLAHAGTALFKSERISGMNKICLYDHLGSEVAITINATSLCPLNIEV
ncbi:hypothetical protein SAMN05720354_1248 [Nitrosospira sp. Nsp1]|nr:hypothetical protein SAMN05720354_1248 [Nitrosospira sp. Nsp1]